MTVFRSPILAGIGILSVLAAMPEAHAADPIPREQEEFFETHVRPIFAAHCTECHGPKKQEASLRLDIGASVLKGGDSGPILDRKDPHASRLLAAVEYDGDLQMPPDGKLADEQIVAIRQWLEMGAPWPTHRDPAQDSSVEDMAGKHWAFQPVARPALPDVADAASCENPVDRFLLAQLEAKGLNFAEPADRRTWLRRASFDLLGLPPTIDEVERFAADDAPDAFDRWTDRLLASPHYGEKWARHWLDVARYADTKGYVFTAERRYPFAFTYRDYVIRSLNEDRGYDQFIRDQIAADKFVDQQDPRALAGMGFLTVGRRFLNNNNDILDDRIDVVSRGLLGLTVACARCHDHKYDPIPTADYYSLYSVFASSVEPGSLPVVEDDAPPAQRVAFQEAMQSQQQKVDEYIARKGEERERLFQKRIGVLLLAAHEVGGDLQNPRLAEIAREIGTNDQTTRLFVRKWQAFLKARLTPNHPVFGLWSMFLAAPQDDFANKSKQIVQQLRTDATAMGVHPAVAKQFHDATPTDMRQVVENYGKAFAAIEADDIRKSLDEPGSPFQLTSDEVQSCLDQGERNELQGLRNRMEEIKATHPGAPLQAMVMQDGPAHDTRVLIRGNPGRPGDPVPRQFLAILEGPDRKPFSDGSGRRELAERIADPDNPLTARVMVNRIWHWHFNRGIVATTSDFGLRSDPPTHPQLLDWLAAEFSETGWSIKRMHRAMMTSTAYRQRSVDRPEAREADPENDLLWSFRRRRLEFEELRDALLFVSGELDDEIHGRPADLTGAAPTRRRAVYAFIDRQNLDGLFRTFDFANPNTSAPLRFVTTVPQQALYMMNSPFVLERSRSLARNPEFLAAPSTEHRIEALYHAVFNRSPSPAEMDASREFALAQETFAAQSPLLTWRYGYGQYDRANGRLTSFHPMNHWDGRQWRPERSIPTEQFGHLSLIADGGHPGKSRDSAAVRRWVAPRAMRIAIQGVFRHGSDKGDGVAAVVSSSRQGELARWTIKNEKREFAIDELDVEVGETLDFIVEPGSTDSFDSFGCTATIESLGDYRAGQPTLWDSTRDFASPSDLLSGWEKLAHVLLLTNEFSFVD